LVCEAHLAIDVTTEPEAEKADRLPEKTGDLVVDALLMLGRLMLLSGNAVSDIDIELRGAARAWNAPEAQFIVLPNMMLASFEVDKPAHIMSRDRAADHLRLDQVIRLMHMSRMIRLGEVTPEEALDEMRRIETSQRRRA